MKTKFNITLCALLLFTALVSCSTGRYASAQYDANEDTYSNSDQDTYSNSSDNYDDYDYNNNDYYDNGSSAVSIDVFVDQLSPYGRWITSPSYGQVWICNEAGFVPYYSNGHWVYTHLGWTWVSSYNWGWAPFHYGRWAYDPFYGWMWVPGYEWGPAWVGWRTGGDYYGWAPLAPGINISLGFSWGNYMPADRWCFVPRRYIANPHFNHYVVDRGRNLTIINNTTIIKNTNVYRNTKYIVGPSRTEVERFTGNRINTVRINNDTRPGNTRMVDNRTIGMYRPQIKKDDRLTPERVNADKVRSLQSQSNRNQNMPLQQNRNIRPQENNNLPQQQKKDDMRTPQRNEVPPVKDRKPNINDRIDNNIPDIRRDDNNYIPDNKHKDISEDRRVEQMNMQRIDQERQIQKRVDQQNNNNRPDYRIEKRDDNSYQRKVNPNINQQPVTRGWQPVQQMPQRRVQEQSDNQYQQQPYQTGGRRRN
jgi:hypothetical protein